MSRFDVMETEDALEYRAALPEFDQEDIEVTVSGSQLTITAQHEALEEDCEEEEAADEEDVGTYMVGESSDGFIQLLTLPAEADAGRVEAHFEDGVLTVRVAKSASCRVVEPPED